MRLQYEAVPESLKNVVLVMHSTGMLTPPASPDVRTEAQKQLWTRTSERLGRFLGPDVLADVVPQSSRVEPEDTVNPAVPAASTETHPPPDTDVKQQ